MPACDHVHLLQLCHPPMHLCRPLRWVSIRLLLFTLQPRTKSLGLNALVHPGGRPRSCLLPMEWPPQAAVKAEQSLHFFPEYPPSSARMMQRAPANVALPIASLHPTTLLTVSNFNGLVAVVTSPSDGNLQVAVRYILSDTPIPPYPSSCLRAASLCSNFRLIGLLFPAEEGANR